MHLWFSTYPPTYTLHTTQCISPGTCLSVATISEDPLIIYTYARDTIFFYPTPPHDDCSMTLDATWWIRSGKDAKTHENKVGGWGMYVIQELSTRDEIVLGWEWDNVHPIHGGKEGKLEAVNALEGTFVT